MDHRHLSLLACLALVVPACAKSNAESAPPEAPGEVTEDVPEGGEAGGDEAAPKRTPKGTTSSTSAGGAAKASDTRMSAKKPVRRPKRGSGSKGGDSGGDRTGKSGARRPSRGGGGDGGDGGGGDEEVVGDNGLLGEVFAIGEITSLPDFGSLGEAAGQIDAQNVDFTDGFPGVDGEGFALRFTGSFNVVEEGEYNLCLNSADGSRLLLEDTLVVDNDGRHAAQKACEMIYLEAGEYGLEIDYFKGGSNGAVLQFLWGRGEAEPEVVPVEVLFRPGT
jgi:hypothetical protein